MMKKQLLTTSIITALVMAAGIANAADGTIVFTGIINDGSCDISANSINQTIPLDSISSVHVNGSTAGQAIAGTGKPFEIELTNCAAGKSVQVQFGDAAQQEGTYNAFTTTGAGTGVAIQLLDGQNADAEIVPGIATTAFTLPASGGDATLTYTAQYLRNAASVAAGDVSSTVDYTLSYN